MTILLFFQRPCHQVIRCEQASELRFFVYRRRRTTLPGCYRCNVAPQDYVMGATLQDYVILPAGSITSYLRSFRVLFSPRRACSCLSRRRRAL